MNQTPTHTTPPPSSQAAAYGYKHAGSMASQGVAWRFTLTEPGNMAYGGSVSVGWYSGSSKSGYSFPIAAAIGIGARYIAYRQIGEQDEKLGYSYFGARYLDAELSLWLSVDPMADKYPSMSPFMYTAGNPVMLVDPDGRKWGKPGEDENNNSDRKQANEMRSNFVKKRDEYKSKYDAKYKEIQGYAGDRNSKEYKNMIKEAREFNAGYVDMQNGIQEIDRITNDENYYTFSGNNKTFNTLSVGKNSDGTYTITINYNSSSVANKVHEVAHAAQIVDGKMTIHQNGNKYEFRSTYTLPNLERSAYLRQYFYNKNSMPIKIGSYKEIISLKGIEGYLRKINKKLGHEAYRF